MRVASLGVARPAYYDRNAAPQTNEYSATVAPHTFTVRFTYTVPAGKKGILEYAYVAIARVTAPGAASTYFGTVQCVSSSIQLRSPYVENNSAVAGLALQQHLPLAITIYTGEIVQAQTYDGSTGGTVFYTLQSKVTVYDA